MNRRLLSTIAVAIAGLGAFVVNPAPASAGSNYLTTQIGVRYYGDGNVPPGTKGPAYLTSDLRDKCVFASIVTVQVGGDYVYVQDACADGKSALGQVQFRDNGDGYTRRCRNNLGAGTVVRCNFDWPEGPTKVLSAASKAYPDGAITYGTQAPFTG